MLQIMSFDSWSSGIARPIILDPEVETVKASIFFMTYVFASAIIMANVVLAILIDKFLSTAKEIFDAETKLEEEEKAAKRKAKMDQVDDEKNEAEEEEEEDANPLHTL